MNTSEIDNLPDVFCWSKMGFEANQPLELILRRKDHERLYGAGEVWWGIGEKLHDRIKAIVKHAHPKNPIIALTPDRKAQRDLQCVQR